MLLAASLMVVVVLAAVVLPRLLAPDRGYDPSFAPRVDRPLFATPGPRVVVDEGHRNLLLTQAALRPFVELLRRDGFMVDATNGPISSASLEGARVLILGGARGSNDANDDSAFDTAELEVIEQWIRRGGSLLVVTDHWPFGSAANELLARFGASGCAGLVEDPSRGDAERGPSHVIASRDNGGLVDHPITDGRSKDERVERVMTFTGQSLSTPPGGTALLTLSDTAISYPPRAPTVERSGGDVRVHMEYGAPTSAAGRAQAIAFEFGEGRVVVLADAGMIRAHRDGRGRPVGMNATDYDNMHFARGIMRWLARAE